MRPIHTPLTIVSIVSNVVALVLVSLLIYPDPQSSRTILQKLASSITKMAEVDQVLTEDILREFGKPLHEWPTEWNWIGRWNLAIKELADTGDVTYQITIDSVPHESADGKYVYRIDIQVVQTWRSGLKYLQANLARALHTGSLFPLRPHIEVEGQRLSFPLPAGKQIH